MNGHANDIGIVHLPRETAEMRETFWQGRVLAAAKGKTAAVAMSVIAHQIKDTIALKTLLEIVFPGYVGISQPFIASCGRITAMGRVIAEIVDKQNVRKWTVIYETEAAMEKAFRDLADEIKLPDAARVALFDAIKAWITCDYRLDPSTGEKETVREMEKKYRKVS
jgi:hypothetical protein